MSTPAAVNTPPGASDDPTKADAEASTPRRSPARALARRRRLALALVLVLLLGVFAARVLLGDFPISFVDFFTIVFGGHVDVPGADYILMESKLPRALACLLAGGVFGAAGAALQSMVRNPLASPDVLGISLGSSTAAVFCTTILGWSGMPVTFSAILGGFAVAALILLMAKGQTPRMILVGIAVAAALQSVIQWILLKSSAFQAQDAMAWLAGSVSAVDWAGITRLAFVSILVVGLLTALGHSLRVLELGRPTAIGLGIRDGRVRALTFGGVVVGVAVATSVCGPIAFVALLAGPIAGRIMGRTAIFTAACIGAIIAISGDYIGAYLVPGNNKLPVGVVTGLAGAPVLAWLLLTSQRPARRSKGTR